MDSSTCELHTLYLQNFNWFDIITIGKSKPYTHLEVLHLSRKVPLYVLSENVLWSRGNAGLKLILPISSPVFYWMETHNLPSLNKLLSSISKN